MKFLNLFSLLLLSLAFTAESAMATVGHPATPLPLLAEQRLNNSALTAPIVKLGTQLTQKKIQVLKAVYDFAKLGGASGSSIILKDASGGDATLPKDAIVKQVTFAPVTALTSTGSATLSFGVESASTDMKAATAIATYNAGFVSGIQTGAIATWTRVPTYNKALGMKVGVAPITAGKLLVFVEYYLGAPNY